MDGRPIFLRKEGSRLKYKAKSSTVFSLLGQNWSPACSFTVFMAVILLAITITTPSVKKKNQNLINTIPVKSPVHRETGINFSRPTLKAAGYSAGVREAALPEDADGRLGVVAILADEVQRAIVLAVRVRHACHFGQGVPEPGKPLPQLVQRDVHRVGYGGDLEVVYRPHVQQQVRPAAVDHPLVFSAGGAGALWERRLDCHRLRRSSSLHTYISGHKFLNCIYS